MENQTSGQANGTPNDLKRPVERSASYPSISIEAALAFALELSKNFSVGQVFNRDDIAAVLKANIHSIKRDVAVAAQYGLVEKLVGEGYKLTAELKNSYVNALDVKEKQQYLLKVFGTPKLYAELIEKYDGHAIPAELRVILIRFHRIADNAAQLAADVFLENARFVGALAENGLLQYKQQGDKLISPNFQYAEVFTEEKRSPAADMAAETVANIGQQYQLIAPHTKVASPTQWTDEAGQASEGEKRITIHLTGDKTANLTYPKAITEKDIIILQKQLEVLALTIE